MILQSVNLALLGEATAGTDEAKMIVNSILGPHSACIAGCAAVMRGPRLHRMSVTLIEHAQSSPVWCYIGHGRTSNHSGFALADRLSVTKAVDGWV
jgi:hypothetical protein